MPLYCSVGRVSSNCKWGMIVQVSILVSLFHVSAYSTTDLTLKFVSVYICSCTVWFVLKLAELLLGLIQSMLMFAFDILSTVATVCATELVCCDSVEFGLIFCVGSVVGSVAMYLSSSLVC